MALDTTGILLAVNLATLAGVVYILRDLVVLEKRIPRH